MHINDDLYAILGVSSDASEEDIKKAYRELAKEHHPDKNKGNKESEEKFKKISAAYDVIGDSDKRKRYDDIRRHGNGPRFAQGDGSFQRGSGFSRGFSSFFNNIDMMFNQGKQDQNYVKNLDLSLALDVYGVAKGREITVEFPIDECCEDCGGKGKEKNSKESRCVRCAGTGEFRTINGNMMFVVPCPDCKGKGEIFERCLKCNGVGVVPKNKKIDVKIPKGMRDGSTLCVRGVGHFSPGTKSRGDINIHIGISEHNFFKLANEDVHIQIPVKFKDLIIGTKIKVPTLYCDAMVDIPPESQSGSVFRLSKMGVHVSPNNQKVGDMFVHVIVDMPKGFSSSFKEKVMELDDSSAQYEMGNSYSEMLKEIERERSNES